MNKTFQENENTINYLNDTSQIKVEMNMTKP
jgi:hypothetical protein